MGPLELETAPVLLALAKVVLGVLALVAAKLLKPLLSPYKTDEELTRRDNPAYGFALAGYYLAVIIVFVGVAQGRDVPLEEGTAGALQALAADLGWTLAGVAALSFSRWLLDHTLVSSSGLSQQIVGQRNVAAGVVECCVFIASGLVLAGALREPGGSLWTTLVFFALSQGVLLLFGQLYRRLAGYDVTREILDGNPAAGAAFGLTLVAIALLMLKATSGEFIDWNTNLAYFAFDALAGFALLLLLRWVTDAMLLPNARLADEIVRDRNLNVGLVEGIVAAGIAAIILFVF